MEHAGSMLGAIGHTPLMELAQVVPPGAARVCVTLDVSDSGPSAAPMA